MKAKGLRIKDNMTHMEANSLCARGEGAIREIVPAKTASGRDRNVSTLKVPLVDIYMEKKVVKYNKKKN